MSTAPTPRRVQQRTLETRGALLDAAVDAFTTRGFDGISVRQLEELAGVNRGLVAYHFGDKDNLWRAAVDQVFGTMAQVFADRLGLYGDLSAREAARQVIRTFVRHSAAHPEVNRLMMQECMHASWRVDYIVTTHVRPMLDGLAEAAPEVYAALYGDGDPHRYYTMVGAGAFVFSAEHECISLFGANPRNPAFIERHADLITELLLPGPSQGEST